MLDLLREPSTAMPRYWAGFILIGDANQSVPIQPRRQWVEKNRWILAGCLMLSVIALLAPVAYKKQEGKVYAIGVRRLNFALRTSLCLDHLSNTTGQIPESGVKTAVTETELPSHTRAAVNRASPFHIELIEKLIAATNILGFGAAFNIYCHPLALIECRPPGQPRTVRIAGLDEVREVLLHQL